MPAARDDVAGDSGDRLDQAPGGYLEFSDDGTIRYANATFAALLGRPAAELIGQSLDSLLTPAGRVFYQTHLLPLLRLQGHLDEIFLPLRLPHGPDLPLLVNAVRTPTAAGAITRC